MTTVSVLMPVHNGEEHVELAVRSILEQTFGDFELILFDDGSSDGTLQILKRLQQLDGRIRLISRENRGLVSTLNEGIDLARGVWIARMDSDDISKINRFERQLDWLHKSGADICGSWAQNFGSVDHRILQHPSSMEAIRVALLFGAPLVHPSVMMKREWAVKLRYDPDWETCEDYDLWERAIAAGALITNVPEVLLDYRQHAAQVSARSIARQAAMAQNIRLRYWPSYWAANKLKRQDGMLEILKLRENPLPPFDVDKVEEACETLLQSVQGEARQTMWRHLSTLYIRGATQSLTMLKGWHRLNRRFGTNRGGPILLTMLMMNVFGLKPGGKLYDWIKQKYLRLVT